MAPKHALLSCSGGGGGVNGEARRAFPPSAWILDAGMVAVCSPWNGKRTRAQDVMLARCGVILGTALMLMVQCSSAADGKTHLMLCYYPTRKSDVFGV